MDIAILETILTRIQCGRCLSIGEIAFFREPDRLIEDTSINDPLREEIRQFIDYEDGLIFQCRCGQLMLLRGNDLINKIQEYDDDLSSWFENSIIKFEENQIKITEETPQYKPTIPTPFHCVNCDRKLNRKKFIKSAINNKIHRDIRNNPKQYTSKVNCNYCDFEIHFSLDLSVNPHLIKLEDQ